MILYTKAMLTIRNQIIIIYEKYNTVVNYAHTHAFRVKIPPVSEDQSQSQLVQQQQVHRQKHLQSAVRSSGTCGHASSMPWQHPSDKLPEIHSQQMTDSTSAKAVCHCYPWQAL